MYLITFKTFTVVERIQSLLPLFLKKKNELSIFLSKPVLLVQICHFDFVAVRRKE